MRRKILLGACVAFVSLSFNVSASSVFPSAFSSENDVAKNCSIASDIIPGFCAPSGPGSFSAAVKRCAPGGMSMQGIYVGMLATGGGSLPAACAKNAKEYGGTVAGCVGQWTCYWNGGQASDMSGLCDGDGKPCATF